MLNEDVKESIKILVSKIGVKENQSQLNDVLVSIARMAIDGTDTMDLKLFSRAVREFRKSFKVFGQYRNTRKVCVFGSSRTPEQDPQFQIAEAFSKAV